MGVAVDTETEFRFEPAQVLVESGFLPYETAMYDVAADGRFVTVREGTGQGSEDEGFDQLVVVLNWFEELKRLAPAD